MSHQLGFAESSQVADIDMQFVFLKLIDLHDTMCAHVLNEYKNVGVYKLIIFFST